MRPVLAKTEFKETYYGIGLMSGTSLDGLDVAICSFDLNREYRPKLIHFDTIAWPDDLERLIRKCTSVESVNLFELTYLNRKASEFFAEAIEIALKRAKVNKKKVDFIGSHGHTIYHIPSSLSPDKKAATLQLIDADHIARKLGIVTISDFRQKHIAAGGEGAPLVVYGDHALFSDTFQNRVLLNIGGMANLTWLPANSKIDEVLTTDTGPGNKLIDLAVNQEFPKMQYDVGGDLAAKGTVIPESLTEMLQDEFFQKEYPKSTGTEYFNSTWLQKYTKNLDPLDRIATLTALTAESITQSALHFAKKEDFTLYVSGGGAYNKTLITMLAKRLPEMVVAPFDELGFSADSKEAVLFCWLGFQTFLGMALISSKQSGITKPVCLGKISLPD